MHLGSGNAYGALCSWPYIGGRSESRSSILDKQAILHHLLLRPRSSFVLAAPRTNETLETTSHSPVEALGPFF